MYTYENPLDQGYKQFKLTKKQHNELFPMRKSTWKNKFEYYYNDNGVILHRFSSPLVIMLNVIMFPIIVLMNGLGKIKELLREYKELFNEKKYGSFSSDYVWSNTEKYNEIMKIANTQEAK